MILAAAMLLLAPDPVPTAVRTPDMPSTASPWRELGEARGVRILYDPAPVARAGELLTVRVLSRYWGGPPEDAAYFIGTVEIRCAAGEARVTRTTNHRADHVIVSDDASPQSFAPIRGDSLFAGLREALC